MIAPAWNGPPIGVMRTGFLAVSGCRPPMDSVSWSEAVRLEWDLFSAIQADVRRVVKEAGLIVVHGGAGGIDDTAYHAALKHDLGHERHLPDYRTHKKAAPLIRNAYVTTTERAVFWPAPWSRGTWDAVEKRLRACGKEGFELRLVGWGRGGVGVPEGVKAMLGKVGAAWTEVG